MTDEAALRIQGVCKSFRAHLWLRTRKILHDLSLTVSRGTIHGLLGPNGAGKTTTIRVTLGLLRPDSGRVSLLGRPASDPQARRRVGFLPENPSFYDYLTAREFLDLSGRLIGAPRASRPAEIERLLGVVGMADRADIPLRRCSKGMVQRIGLAQALIGDPEMIVLDEPMSGLDPVGRREFRDLILEQRRAGRTVFFSSHILQDAEMICDRVSIIDRGRNVAEGELSTLLRKDVTFWEVTVLDYDPSRLNGGWQRVPMTGGAIVVRVSTEADLDRLVQSVTGCGGRVRSVIPYRETLEDLFLKEIGRASAPESRPVSRPRPDRREEP